MPTEQIGKFEIEYEAAALPDNAGWAAYVAIFSESDNPAHRNNVVPRERVAVGEVFADETSAVAAAQRIGQAMLTAP